MEDLWHSEWEYRVQDTIESTWEDIRSEHRHSQSATTTSQKSDVGPNKVAPMREGQYEERPPHLFIR